MSEIKNILGEIARQYPEHAEKLEELEAAVGENPRDILGNDLKLQSPGIDMEFRKLYKTARATSDTFEKMAKGKGNNEEYTKALTDAALALRALVRFW